LSRFESGAACQAEQGCISLLPVENLAACPSKLPPPELRLAERVVILHRMSRAGAPMRLAVPLDHYKGISADICYTMNGLQCHIILAHENRDYEITLFSAQDDENILAEWNAFARRLELPLMIRSEHGDALARPQFGSLQTNGVSPRRARHMFLIRRPRFLRRRSSGKLSAALSVYKEREIIARD
jgi:hypothetical protein